MRQNPYIFQLLFHLNYVDFISTQKHDQESSILFLNISFDGVDFAFSVLATADVTDTQLLRCGYDPPPWRHYPWFYRTTDDVIAYHVRLCECNNSRTAEIILWNLERILYHLIPFQNCIYIFPIGNTNFMDFRTCEVRRLYSKMTQQLINKQTINVNHHCVVAFTWLPKYEACFVSFSSYESQILASAP